jgi:4,5-dihydroxyphthalate decarboxylase
MKREVYEKHPWVALNIFNAFSRARDSWLEEVRENVAPYLATGSVSLGEKRDLPNLFPYGVRANNEILNAIPRFSHEQGLTPRVVGLDEVFAPQTLDL